MCGNKKRFRSPLLNTLTEAVGALTFDTGRNQKNNQKRLAYNLDAGYKKSPLIIGGHHSTSVNKNV